MGHLNGPYYPHALIQGFAYAHITLFAYLMLMILPFLTFPLCCILEQTIWLSTCTLVSNTDSIRVYTDCAMIWYSNSENTVEPRL